MLSWWKQATLIFFSKPGIVLFCFALILKVAFVSHSSSPMSLPFRWWYFCYFYVNALSVTCKLLLAAFLTLLLTSIFSSPTEHFAWCTCHMFCFCLHKLLWRTDTQIEVTYNIQIITQNSTCLKWFIPALFPTIIEYIHGLKIWLLIVTFIHKLY